MPTPRSYLILTLLLALTASCAEQTPRHPAPVLPTDSSSTPIPALSTVEGSALQPTATQQPAATKKPPKGTKAPGSGQGQGQGSDQSGGPSQSLSFDIPEHSLDVILGRPTDISITVSLLSPVNDQTLLIAYGTQSRAYTVQTERFALQAGIPREVTLTGLTPNTTYYYTVDMGGHENTFHTARASGSTFTFTIQADSHLDSNTAPQVYLQTLANQRADQPDFMIDLGDTFMTEKYKPYTAAEPQYLAQRYLIGQVAADAALFLVLGNHDGEGAPQGQNGIETSAWAAKQRTRLFPNPIPDSFYSGNSTPNPEVGYLQDYYAWTWGDAMFIVLDPFWSTASKPQQDNNWGWTLGKTQYDWLKSTLEGSQAKYKFVFIHNLVGGNGKDSRGGAEAAPFYEWGGDNADGSYGFDEHRPGWGAPIHPLLVGNHVTAVFHGHDHLFVKQELDGIIYQECPQPGNSRPGNTDSAAEYGYLSGDVLGGPGHIRVTVGRDAVTVDYVRTYLPQDEKPGQLNGEVDYSYKIK